MSKKPDFNDLKSKFNLDKIVDGITSIVELNDVYAEMDPKDELGKKIQLISEKIGAMHKAQAEHAKDLQQIEQLLKDMFSDVEKVRAKSSAAKTKSTTKSAKTKKKDDKATDG